MANYLIENRIDIEQLHKFQAFGYKFSKSDSTLSKPVFLVLVVGKLLKFELQS